MAGNLDMVQCLSPGDWITILRYIVTMSITHQYEGTTDTWNNVGKAGRQSRLVMEARNQSAYTIWVHLYDILEMGEVWDRMQINDCQGLEMGKELDFKGYQRTWWGDRNVQSLSCTHGYLTIYICQNLSIAQFKYMDFVIGKIYLKVDFSKSELAKSYLKSISIIAYHKSFANAFHIYLKKNMSAYKNPNKYLGKTRRTEMWIHLYIFLIFMLFILIVYYFLPTSLLC